MYEIDIKVLIGGSFHDSGQYILKIARIGWFVYALRGNPPNEGSREINSRDLNNKAARPTIGGAVKEKNSGFAHLITTGIYTQTYIARA